MSKTGVSLFGLLAEEEAFEYLGKHVVLSDRSLGTLKQKWHDAHNRLKTYTADRAGQPDILPMPDQAADHLERLQSHPHFPLLTMGHPYSFGLVEIDTLLSFQLHTLTDVVDSYGAMAKNYRRTRAISDVLPYCLPTQVFNGPAHVAEGKCVT